MEANDNKKSVFVVLSQTGTLLSHALKKITRKEYNHASITPYEDLHVMYSFGRKHAYNPFLGGFVKESIKFGTFKRFPKAKIIVLKITVSDQDYSNLCSMMDFMINHTRDYGYNYWGLWLAGLGICIKSEGRYYCSEFVRDMLISHNVEGAKKMEQIVHPTSFIDLPECETVFCGRLCDYFLSSATV